MKKTTITKSGAYKKRSIRYRKQPTNAITRAVRKSHQIKYFTEFFQASSIATVPALPTTAGSFNVALASLPNFTQYLNLFDQFCIINFEVHLLQKMGAMNNNVGGLPLTFASAINRDGKSALLTPVSLPTVLS